MTPDLLVRRASRQDAEAISRLNNTFAIDGQMLNRTPEMISLAIEDYVVVRNGSDELLACGALKEYSPSIAEVAAVAVSKAAHGKGLGRAIVNAVEALARKRGIYDVFALTLQPEFFATIGYQRVDRARYPEKIRRDCLGCVRRFACNEICFAKNLMLEEVADLLDRIGGSPDRVSGSLVGVGGSPDRVVGSLVGVSGSLSESSVRLSESADRLTESPVRLSESADRLTESPDCLTELPGRLTESTDRLTESAVHLTESSVRLTELAVRPSGSSFVGQSQRFVGRSRRFA